MIAAHRGLYSLGLVLTLGVGTCLLVSVITVPAILTWITRHRAARARLTLDEVRCQSRRHVAYLRQHGIHLGPDAVRHPNPPRVSEANLGTVGLAR